MIVTLNLYCLSCWIIQELLEHKKFSDWEMKKRWDCCLARPWNFPKRCLFPLNIEGDKIGLQFEAGQVRAVPGNKGRLPGFRGGRMVNALWGWGLRRTRASGNYQVCGPRDVFLPPISPSCAMSNLTHDAAKLIELFGTDRQKRAYLDKMYGRSMDRDHCAWPSHRQDRT